MHGSASAGSSTTSSAAGRPGCGPSSRGCQWHRNEGAGARKLSLRFVRNRCRELPAMLCSMGAAPERGAAAGQGRLRWITSCVEERGLGEGTEVCEGLGGSLHSVCSCNTSVTSHSCVRITTHPPPDRSQQIKQTARSAALARPGAELQRQASMLSLQPLWGSSLLTDHLLPDRPEAPLRSSQVSAKGFRMQQCPMSEGREG